MTPSEQQHAGTVSIHAFRGEGDVDERVFLPLVISFNPRLPGGRRRSVGLTSAIRDVFQSTPSGGKATGAVERRACGCAVSIHAFRGEGDRNI